MSAIKELLHAEEGGGISFGNYELEIKTKVSDFEYQGDLYKVKTYKEITKLEKNDTFVYESVPGTVVTGLKQKENGMEFAVEGAEDAQITVGLEEDTEYEVVVDGIEVGYITTNLGGKLSFSVELEKAEQVKVQICRVK